MHSTNDKKRKRSESTNDQPIPPPTTLYNSFKPLNLAGAPHDPFNDHTIAWCGPYSHQPFPPAPPATSECSKPPLQIPGLSDPDNHDNTCPFTPEPPAASHPLLDPDFWESLFAGLDMPAPPNADATPAHPGPSLASDAPLIYASSPESSSATSGASPQKTNTALTALTPLTTSDTASTEPYASSATSPSPQ
jgi:hypothetical protein